MEDEHPLSGVIVAKRANEFRIQVARHWPKRSYAQVAAAASPQNCAPQFVTVKAEKLALKFDIKCPACYRTFANIVNYFLEVAEKYPHETWYSDQVFGCQPLYGVEGVNNPDE
jgi:hypothetical protein